ncbi:hypothetical protein J40TS1_48280 [Paenibacillus montaniterrae]|uniref:DUF6843 domain-containing protein n=1 Tax=Paenibacillus montaniterrae TaxID=429341 RepID=A0A919YVB6_9BACL|nr:hypothetical protein [Paenibacillus montaniterrae]GIP19186.1 hypothetical protein J40TS1_48280 [Paenibacillus montaniterrae]
MMRVYKIYLIVFAVIIIAAIAIGTIGINKQKTHIFVMPNGYSGWVRVVYEQQDSPALPMEGKAFLHEIPEEGILFTSSPPTSGLMLFYVKDKHGTRTEIGTDMIQGQSMGTKTIKFPDGTTKDAEVNSFFVGTEQQYNDEIEQ